MASRQEHADRETDKRGTYTQHWQAARFLVESISVAGKGGEKMRSLRGFQKTKEPGDGIRDRGDAFAGLTPNSSPSFGDAIAPARTKRRPEFANNPTRLQAEDAVGLRQKRRIWGARSERPGLSFGGLLDGPQTSNLTALAVEVAERGAIAEAREADRSAAE
jgi:hypothetical protein